MKQKKTNEELQSRREFFKKAAKAALPVVGVVVLSTLPLNADASTFCNGCSGSCADTCSGTCSGNCTGDCSTSCKGTCEGSCNKGCGSKCKF